MRRIRLLASVIVVLSAVAVETRATRQDREGQLMLADSLFVRLLTMSAVSPSSMVISETNCWLLRSGILLNGAARQRFDLQVDVHLDGTGSLHSGGRL